MRARQLSREVEAETGTGYPCGRRVATYPAESREQHREILFIDADALVANHDRRPVAAALHDDADISVLHRIFQRVLHEIGDGDDDTGAVDARRDRLVRKL